MHYINKKIKLLIGNGWQSPQLSKSREKQGSVSARLVVTMSLFNPQLFRYGTKLTSESYLMYGIKWVPLTLQVSLLKSSRHFAIDFHGARISYLFPLTISKHEENFLLKNPEKKCETEGCGEKDSSLGGKAASSSSIPADSNLCHLRDSSAGTGRCI